MAAELGEEVATLSLARKDIVKLDPAKAYAVYTQKAHGESATDPSQNTETPVTIDFDSLTAAPKVSAASTTYGDPATVTVDVAPATGAVALSVDGVTQTADTDPQGIATFSLTGLTAGDHALSASYEGDAWYVDGAATATLTVAKAAAPAISARGLTTTYGRGGAVSVTTPVAGTVTIPGLGAKTTTGAGSVPFPVAWTRGVGQATYQVSFTPADASYLPPAATTVTVKVTKAAAGRPTLRVNKKPTSKKAGKVTVRVGGVSGAAAPSGTVTIRFKKGKSVKTKTVALLRGSRTVAVPKLKKGTWQISVSYQGDSRYTPRAYAYVGKTKVTK